MRMLMLLFFLLFFNDKLSAFDVPKVKKEIFLELVKELKGNSKNKPILLLIGGYPGAGKTTLIKALANTYDIDVISWNDIRQALLDRRLKGSPYDWEIIQAVNEDLFKICVSKKANIVIDANAHAKNIEIFENLLIGNQDYRIIKICLNPEPEILLKRVKARIQRPELHQGTEADVIKDLSSESKKIHLEEYLLIIKNDEIDFETEWDIVNAFLTPVFNQQNEAHRKK